LKNRVGYSEERKSLNFTGKKRIYTRKVFTGNIVEGIFWGYFCFTFCIPQLWTGMREKIIIFYQAIDK
jgi:hypothetical protein